MIRERQASSNETAGISLIRSIRKGRTPLKQRARRGEVRGREVAERSTESLDCSQYPLRIAELRADEDVEILRRTEVTMRRDSVCTDDEKLSSCGEPLA